jgi:hypothetical protein
MVDLVASNRDAAKHTNSNGITAHFFAFPDPVTPKQICKAKDSRPNCQGTGYDQAVDVVAPFRAAVLGAVLFGAQ